MVILSNFTAVPAANAAPQNTRFPVNLLTVIWEKICMKGEIAAQELPAWIGPTATVQKPVPRMSQHQMFPWKEI